MKRIKVYLINNLFKIEYVITKSDYFPLGMEIKCGSVQLGSWKTTDNLHDYPPSFQKWKLATTMKAEISQIQQFNEAYPNDRKLLIGFVNLKIKIAFKTLKSKFSKVS